ncbi:MAG: SAM-dependent DNA methyltransferase [Deltaproteobacteria bacterium]|jgi:hypothetical protein|nr:SAM-dependent DNA methyltransferase [Deltaproteobacteria bacterium]
MPPLNKPQRNLLERTVGEAREAAEAATEAALTFLGVREPSPPPYLDSKGRALRERLRARARGLGEELDGWSSGTAGLLAEEAAYERWHGMLFARFLAENSLLMYPAHDGAVPVTLEECGELAAGEGASDGWELAARYAARMLPQIFRVGSPAFDLSFPPEYRQRLEGLVAGLPRDVFLASDALGWGYQFWQSRKRDRVNASGVAVGARELPAVTQLFTDGFMVGFLLDNTLGAWWAARRLSAEDLKSCDREDVLRLKAGLPGMPLRYLRFAKSDGGGWTLAGGDCGSWPDSAADLRVMDPCCGSGHFLVAAMAMLVPMRMEAEGLSARDAVDAVLRDNIHGLELDPRCVEICAFALALAAWTYPGAGGYRPLPVPNVACSGLPVGAAKESWLSFAKGDQKAESALAGLYDRFREAPLLGSLIEPEAGLGKGSLLESGWDEVAPLVEKALSSGTGMTGAGDRMFGGHLDEDIGRAENDGVPDDGPHKGNGGLGGNAVFGDPAGKGSSAESAGEADESSEAAVAALGLSRAARLLAGSYALVATNVPYLTRGKQTGRLRELCAEICPEAKNNLATVFLDRCLGLCGRGGSAAVVLPENLMFLVSYRKFREKLLKGCAWRLVARLGSGAFATIAGEIVKVALLIVERGAAWPSGYLPAMAAGTDNLVRGLDVSRWRSPAEKAARLVDSEVASVGQSGLLRNPDSVVTLEEIGEGLPLSLYARTLAGTDSGDSARFRLRFWELAGVGDGWILIQNASSSGDHYDGLQNVLRWEGGKGEMARCPGARISNVESWGAKGVYVSRMGELKPALSAGVAWDRNGTMVVPAGDGHLKAIWCFCSSDGFRRDVRKLNQKLNVSDAILGKVPFDPDRWAAVADGLYPAGLPGPYSDDPTQAVFHGHPCGSVVWNGAAKRLEPGTCREDWTVLQVAAARLLGYRWPAERDLGMELAPEQRELVARCSDLAGFADRDGIVAIPAVRGEAAARDRLLDLLAASYGQSWSNDVMSRLLASAGYAGRNLEDWLRDGFFAGHCRLFLNRPFVWQIWDGTRDGFSALANCHDLGFKALESLTYAYLGDWILRQRHGVRGGLDGARGRLAAAEALRRRLETILEGEAPYDIFVRWKPPERQPVGWNPDIADGVRVNIRPFMTPPDVGRKGAGILRDRPNLGWAMDRGKDDETSPWHSIDKGDRVNDRHLALARKCGG